MTKPPRSTLHTLGEFTPGLVEATLAARGLGQASLVADWPEIVGREIAGYSRPIQLQWPPRAPKRDPDVPAGAATLILRVESAFALEAQHAAAIIIERVNAHLGWRCVAKIAFRQGPLPARKERKRGLPAPSAEAVAAAAALAAPIEEENLRAALTRLGERVIDSSARRFAEARDKLRRDAKGE
jgi:hypothetical protein